MPEQARPRRWPGVVMVVEQPKDLWTLERSGAHRGVYHCLMGRLEPLDGVGPKDIGLQKLMDRANDGLVREVILATNPNLEGEATATYLTRLLGAMEISVTKLASGLPVGGDLEYADDMTLGRAFEGRRRVN